MASIAVGVPRGRTRPSHPVIVVTVLCLVSAGLYMWMRIPVAQEYHGSFARTCALVHPQDLSCRLTEASVVATTLAAALLVWLSLALPGVILAAAGRRLTAIVPVAVAGAASFVGALLSMNGRSEGLFSVAVSDALIGPHGPSIWMRHPQLAVIVDTALIAAPAMAITLFIRLPRHRPDPLPRHARVTATIVIGGLLTAIRIAWPNDSNAFFVDPQTDSWISSGLMALFAAMIGTDRRWWPWSLVLVAVLLSQGPSAALVAMPWTTAFTWFGGVAPLLVVGLVASLWRPLAVRLAGHRAHPGPGYEHLAHGSIRPIVIANAGAAAMLVLSLIAKATDPLPIQISTPLPTYLGARELAQDVRATMNLELAIGAMGNYRATHGSYAGFDATDGERIAPELEWARRTERDLAVAVTMADEDRAQVVTRSGSGDVVCMQTLRGEVTTLGSSDSVPSAMSRCATEPLTASATHFLDVGAFCTGLDEQGGLVLCRSVQRLLREILARPTAP